MRARKGIVHPKWKILSSFKVNVCYNHVRWEQGRPVQYVNSQHVCKIIVAKQAFRTCFRKVLNTKKEEFSILRTDIKQHFLQSTKKHISVSFETNSNALISKL